MLWHCADFRKYFSVKVNSMTHSAKVDCQKWVIAIYLMSANPLMRVLNETAQGHWCCLNDGLTYGASHLRTNWQKGDAESFGGTVDVDETYIGGKEDNKREDKNLNAGCGAVGKALSQASKTDYEQSGRASGSSHRRGNAESLCSPARGSQRFGVLPMSPARTRACAALILRQARRQRVSARAGVANGMESIRTMLKRGCAGAYHHFGVMCLDHYLKEFTGRHKVRPMGTHGHPKLDARQASELRRHHRSGADAPDADDLCQMNGNQVPTIQLVEQQALFRDEIDEFAPSSCAAWGTCGAPGDHLSLAGDCIRA